MGLWVAITGALLISSSSLKVRKLRFRSDTSLWNMRPVVVALLSDDEHRQDKSWGFAFVPQTLNKTIFVLENPTMLPAGTWAPTMNHDHPTALAIRTAKQLGRHARSQNSMESRKVQSLPGLPATQGSFPSSTKPRIT